MESAKEMLGSLKSKIWFAVTAFAVFNCIVGLLAYLAASYITASTFFLVLIPFLLTSVAQVFFGKWLSGEAVRPIETVSLLARSIERTSAGSLPRTTGAAETDELLDAIHRNVRQMQNFVSLMESVANGDTSAALAPLENPDRLTTSFQKLVSKVVDSVNAKNELDNLRVTMSQMTSAVSQVRNGKGNASTAAPADLDHIIRDVNGMVEKVLLNAARAKNTADKVRSTIAAVVEKEEASARDLNRTAFDFGKTAANLQNLTNELGEAITTTRGLIEKTWQKPESSQKNVNAVNLLRKQIKSALSRLQAVNETSNGIASVSESAEDLARRTNLIALNVSLQGKEQSASKRGSSLLTAEVESLAERSNTINKEITAINDAISSEIKEVEKALQATLGEIANLSALAIESENAIGKFGGQFDHLLEIQGKLVEASNQNSTDTDGSFRELTVSIAQSEQAANQLKETEANLDEFVRLMDDLNAAVGRFRDSDAPEVETVVAKAQKTEPAMPERRKTDAPKLDQPKAAAPKPEPLSVPPKHKVEYMPPADALGANELLEI